MKAIILLLLSGLQIIRGKIETDAYDRILSDGYNLEVHNVTTEDGYILELHRIPGNNTPILLQHGLGGTSDNFILNGPGEALAYSLSDAGYDVWLGNTRGNYYSRKHSTLSPENFRFWNYSLHEMAIYDLPAMINYILVETSQSGLHYIGHSQGATLIMILLSEKPEHNELMKSVYLLAPPVYINHTTSFLARMLASLGVPQPDADRRFSYEFGARNEYVSQFSDQYCHENQAFSIFCELTIDALAGFDSKNINKVSSFDKQIFERNNFFVFFRNLFRSYLQHFQLVYR